MISLLSPKLDLVFKLLFVSDPALLRDLLNQVLRTYDYPALQTVTIRNPTLLAADLSQKFVVLDIHALDDRGRTYDIEMQVQRYPTYPSRTLYYLARLYAQQLEDGQGYDRLRPVLGVHFLDYVLFPDTARYQHCFELRDRVQPERRLTDQLALFLFELPKLPPNGHLPLDQWLHFFNHAPEEADPVMREHYTHSVIQQAFDALERLSADERARLEAEAREKALRDEVTLLNEARREGEERALAAVARRLLTGGESVERVASLTGLTLEQVQALSAQPPRASD